LAAPADVTPHVKLFPTPMDIAETQLPLPSQEFFPYSLHGDPLGADVHPFGFADKQSWHGFDGLGVPRG